MADLKPTISAEQIRRNFADISPPFSDSEASVEAARCLYCYDAPCIKACPTHINIPRFIQQIASSHVKGAAKTIFSENIFGATCGKVCPTSVLCEGACVFNALNKKPIEIGRLQRFASDSAIDNDWQFFRRGKETGKKVAIIGAGPSGLSCAFELSKLGHTCAVYEAQANPGGLNAYGIAGYKLDTADALAEVEYIKKIGIELILNSRIGVPGNPSVEELLKRYDAVFLGCGLGDTASLGIPGEDLEGCMEALDFIRPTREFGYKGCKVGQNVIVLGAGNTAIDAATAAIRLGAAQVMIVYRRTAKEMPAFLYEYEIAKRDGVQFCWLTQPLRINGKNGMVSAVQCHKMKLTFSDNGRGKLESIPGSEHEIPCDMVIKALGQNPVKNLLGDLNGLKIIDGIVTVDNNTYATSIKGLFAGGDCTNGGGEVVDAVEHGKIAASGIDRYLKGKSNG